VRKRVPTLLVLACCIACGSSPKKDDAERRYVATVDLTPIVAQLGAEEQADADAAVERLVAIGDATVPALEAAVAQERHEIALAAIEVLGQMESPRADAALIAIATKNVDAEIRATAVLRLGEGGRPDARPVLEAALADPSDTVSQTAALACGKLCTSPAAIDRIVDMGLKGVIDSDLGRLRTTLLALLNGSDQDAAAHTREAIRSRTAPILVSNAPLDVRARAALIAADAGLPNVEPVITTAAATSENAVIRSAAIHWLGRSGSGAGIPTLEAALHDPGMAAGAALALETAANRGVPEAKDAIARLAASGRPAPPPDR
jgi:HEAT repeat protein